MEYEKLHIKAKEIASALGWIYQCPNLIIPQRWAVLRNPNDPGGEIHISQEYKPDRFRISGTYPNLSWRPEDRVEMTVSAYKPAETIAREVERRLLPTYLPLFKKAIESNQRKEEQKTADNALTNRLADILGVEGRKGCQIYWCGSYIDDFGSPSGTIRISKGHIDLDLRNLPPEKAEAICRVLVAEILVSP